MKAVSSAPPTDYPVRGFENLGIVPGYGGGVFAYNQSLGLVPMHRHEELELNVVVKGTAVYLVEGHRYSISANTLIWLLPQQNHILLQSSPDLSMWITHIKKRLMRVSGRQMDLGTLFNPQAAAPLRRRMPPSQIHQLASMFREAQRLGEERHRDRFNAYLAYIVLSAWEWHSDAPASEGEKPLHPAIVTAVELIQRETEPLSQEQIARLAGISPNWLSSVFKEQMGMTIVEFRNQQRLDRFLRIYGLGDQAGNDASHETVLRAALAAGFGSYTHFHRVFRQAFGVSPRDYLRVRDMRDADGHAIAV